MSTDLISFTDSFLHGSLCKILKKRNSKNIR
nr:MAG TPA: hypothetical protein [Caudoviricetes sp.]